MVHISNSPYTMYSPYIYAYIYVYISNSMYNDGICMHGVSFMFVYDLWCIYANMYDLMYYVWCRYLYIHIHIYIYICIYV